VQRTTIEKREKEPEGQDAAEENSFNLSALLGKGEAEQDNQKYVIVDEVFDEEEAGN